MSFPGKMDELEFCEAREILYTKVYQRTAVKSIVRATGKKH